MHFHQVPGTLLSQELQSVNLTWGKICCTRLWFAFPQHDQNLWETSTLVHNVLLYYTLHRPKTYKLKINLKSLNLIFTQVQQLDKGNLIKHTSQKYSLTVVDVEAFWPSVVMSSFEACQSMGGYTGISLGGPRYSLTFSQVCRHVSRLEQRRLLKKSFWCSAVGMFGLCKSTVMQIMYKLRTFDTIVTRPKSGWPTNKKRASCATVWDVIRK